MATTLQDLNWDMTAYLAAYVLKLDVEKMVMNYSPEAMTNILSIKLKTSSEVLRIQLPYDLDPINNAEDLVKCKALIQDYYPELYL